MCTMQAWACVLSFENERSCRLARKRMEGGDTVAAEIEKGVYWSRRGQKPRAVWIVGGVATWHGTL